MNTQRPHETEAYIPRSDCAFDFTKSFAETIKRFDTLPAGSKADYERQKAFKINKRSLISTNN